MNHYDQPPRKKQRKISDLATPDRFNFRAQPNLKEGQVKLKISFSRKDDGASMRTVQIERMQEDPGQDQAYFPNLRPSRAERAQIRAEKRAARPAGSSTADCMPPERPEDISLYDVKKKLYHQRVVARDLAAKRKKKEREQRKSGVVSRGGSIQGGETSQGQQLQPDQTEGVDEVSTAVAALMKAQQLEPDQGDSEEVAMEEQLDGIFNNDPLLENYADGAYYDVNTCTPSEADFSLQDNQPVDFDPEMQVSDRFVQKILQPWNGQNESYQMDAEVLRDLAIGDDDCQITCFLPSKPGFWRSPPPDVKPVLDPSGNVLPDLGPDIGSFLGLEEPAAAHVDWPDINQTIGVDHFLVGTPYDSLRAGSYSYVNEEMEEGTGEIGARIRTPEMTSSFANNSVLPVEAEPDMPECPGNSVVDQSESIDEFLNLLQSLKTDDKPATIVSNSVANEMEPDDADDGIQEFKLVRKIRRVDQKKSTNPAVKNDMSIEKSESIEVEASPMEETDSDDDDVVIIEPDVVVLSSKVPAPSRKEEQSARSRRNRNSSRAAPVSVSEPLRLVKYLEKEQEGGSSGGRVNGGRTVGVGEETQTTREGGEMETDQVANNEENGPSQIGSLRDNQANLPSFGPDIFWIEDVQWIPTRKSTVREVSSASTSRTAEENEPHLGNTCDPGQQTNSTTAKGESIMCLTPILFA